MLSVNLNVSIDIEFARTFLRPHEIEIIDEITNGTGGGSARTEFRQRIHGAAGKVLRDMMDQRAAAAHGEMAGHGEIGTLERRPLTWPDHPNCRCAPTRVLNGHIQACAAEAIMDTASRTLGAAKYGDPLWTRHDGKLRLNVNVPDGKAFAKHLNAAKPAPRRAHKPVTRREAAAAVRATQRDVKDWETRTRNRRLKKGAAKRKARR